MEEIKNKGDLRHLLKGSVTKINLYCEALLSGSQGKLNEKQVEYLQEVVTASQEMAENINSHLK